MAVGDFPMDGRLNVGYTRCSSRAQDVEDKAFGRMVQRRAIAAWSEMNETTIDVWVHDTCTGATLDREGMAEILALAASGRLGRLVFARQDRLARDAHLADQVYKAVESKGGELVNVQMRFDKSMVGTILRRILDNFAELDRHQIAERTNKGRVEGTKKLGTHLYGYRVLGYRQVPRDECSRRGLPSGTLEIEEEEAQTVRIVVALRERGHGFYGIKCWLNEKGYRTKTGGKFAEATVAKIVANEAFYRAERVGVSAHALGISDEEYARIVPAHPPILPPRAPGQLLLAESMPRYVLKGATIPDDPFADEPLRRQKRRYIHSLTKDFATAVMAIRDLRATGEKFGAIARALNEAGHMTRRGGPFGATAVGSLHGRLDELEPLALEALARTVPDEPRVVADGWDGPARMAHVLSRQGGMSLSKIAAELNEEYGHTPNGGRYFAQTVSRLLSQSPPPKDSLRTVGYMRFTTDGADHHGQEAAIRAWASENALRIDEWYVDRAPAYASADNPELNRLIVDAQEQRAHRIAILSLERVCRDGTVAQGVVRRLSKSAEVYLVGDSGSAARKSTKRKKPPFMSKSNRRVDKVV